MNKCPICNNQTRSGETLRAYWFAPRGWYVVNHLKSDGSLHCGKAGYQLIGDEFIFTSMTSISRFPAAAMHEITKP